LELADASAQVASWFCDLLGEKHIGTALYQNAQGGRVIVYAQNSDMQSGLFGSHARRRWLHGALLWLSQGRFPALPVIPQHGVSLLKQKPGQLLYSFCNLGTDVLTQFTLRWQNAANIRNLQCLQKNGTWQKLKFGVEPAADHCPPKIVVTTNLNCYDWLVLLFQEKTA